MTSIERLDSETKSLASNMHFQFLLPQSSLAADDWAQELKSLASQSYSRALIEALPPQGLYLGLKSLDIEAKAQILRWITTEQWTRLLDYDAWTKDELDPLRFGEWLELMAVSGPEQLLRRFQDLEEEYQVSLICATLEIRSAEDLGLASRTGDYDDEDLGGYLHLNGTSVFFRVKIPDLEDLLIRLIEGLRLSDPGYCIRLLGLAAYAVPHETEELLRRFREGRLEEDGFVTYAEAHRYLRPDPKLSLWQRYHPHNLAKALTKDLTLKAPDSDFWSDIQKAWQTDPRRAHEAERLSGTLRALANAVATAIGLEAHDTKKIQQTARQTTELWRLSLAVLSQNNPQQALKILDEVAPQELFSFGMGIYHYLRLAILGALGGKEPALSARLKKLLDQHAYGHAALMIREWAEPKLGLSIAEGLSSLFKVFPELTHQDGRDRLYHTAIIQTTDLAELSAWVLQVSGLIRAEEPPQANELLEQSLNTQRAWPVFLRPSYELLEAKAEQVAREQLSPKDTKEP